MNHAPGYRNFNARGSTVATFSSCRRRRGLLLVSVLVCLTVAMLLTGAVLKTIALERQQVRDQQHRLQSEYLADSGLARARAQLAANADYAGETWRLDATSFGSRDAATVVISVEAAGDDAAARQVRAVALFPRESAAPARRTKQTKIRLPKTGEAP